MYDVYTLSDVMQAMDEFRNASKALLVPGSDQQYYLERLNAAEAGFVDALRYVMREED